MATLSPDTHHLSINIFGIVRVDIAGTAAAMRNFGG